jgi:hypothetical protein
MYVDDEARYPHEFVDPASGSHGQWWFQAIESYVQASWTNSLYHCPANKTVQTADDLLDNNGITAQGSYGYNSRGTESLFAPDTGLNLGLGKFTSFRTGFPSSGTVKQSAVLEPFAMIVIAEGVIGGGVARPSTNLDVGDPIPANERAAWHRAGENLIFCDGHFEQLKRKEAFFNAIAAPRWNNDHQAHPESW